MQILPQITGTAEITINIDESREQDVYMDYHIEHRANEDGGAQYANSDPYVVVGRNRKVKAYAYLTPLELARLEEKVHEMANEVKS